MSLDVFKKAAEAVTALQTDNAALKATVKDQNARIDALQSEVNAATVKVREAEAAGRAEAARLNNTINERGQRLQDTLNVLESVRVELAEVKQANKELSEKN